MNARARQAPACNSQIISPAKWLVNENPVNISRLHPPVARWRRKLLSPNQIIVENVHPLAKLFNQSIDPGCNPGPTHE
jgi:hypothetical protein